MDANDDELDKLIQETQDIWKSLKNSGVELKDSGVDHSNQQNLDINSNNDSNTNNNIDDLDKIANKLENSTLNIANNSQLNQPNDDKSRTLEGLNLATPTNELSALLMSEEPSKLSQIRFSTPNYKKSKTHTINQDISSSLPDTPFLFSPSLPVHNVGSNNDTNITLASPTITSPIKKKVIISKKNKTDEIDFSEDCWHQINTMLSRTGFSVLMKQHNDNFEQISPKIIICDRFKEVLSKYETLQNQAANDKHLKQQINDLNLRNNELKNELRISSEKINDLKQEMSEIRQANMNHDHKNEDMVINIKRQLEHCKNIIHKKNDEISKIKQKLQQHIEKEALRRENVETIFQSINKRNSRKNNKKDQQQLDVMQMYEEERQKMQNEIKFLRKETRILNQKLLQKEGEDEDNRKKQRKSRKKSTSSNILFTPSSRAQSDHYDSDDIDDDDDDDVVVDLKWKTKREIKKKVESVDDIERAKDLNRMESKKLREKLDAMYREKEELEINLSEQKDKNNLLNIELEKRPSYNEWTRLRNELNEMNKKLLETKKIASLRKYMDTRELIKRDKEIHNLNLTQVDGLPVQIMKEILQDLCRILSIKDVTILVDNVQKITKCVECVPVLEQYISKIVRILISSDHAPELVKISKIAPKNIFDQVLPILKQWVIKLDKVDALTTFRAKTNTILRRRTIYKNSMKDTAANRDKIDDMLQLHEIVKQIEELVESEEYLLNSRECFNNAEKNLVTNPNDLCNRIIRHFQHIFSIKNIEGVFPKMNQIYLELNEMRNLLKTIKSILGLPQNCATNLCFKELQKVIDQNDKSSVKINTLIADTKNPTVITKWNRILTEIQRLLQCKNEDEVVSQCKELIDRCKEYDAVFPRVHNLVNQLRTTLNVEYAHQILPKVKELVSDQQ